jgi:hypothetical protein
VKLFYLKWRKGERQFVTRYVYDGHGNQRGCTLKDWKETCINFGRTEGFTYVGESTAAEYEKRNR